MKGRALPPQPRPLTAGHIKGTWKSVTLSSASMLLVAAPLFVAAVESLVDVRVALPWLPTDVV